jgi:uncharacterized BrkB/YihY/UPF0761 family membrane protein
MLGRRARLEAWQRQLLRHPVVLRLRAASDVFDRGGGGMRAAALAYHAFFTMVPALLLFVSLLGVIIEDRDLRDQLLASLVDQVDPIQQVASAVIDGLSGTGRTGTLIGVLGLLWGATGFYGALDGAVMHMFPGSGQRSWLQRRLRGLVAVVLLLGSMLVAVVVVFALPFVVEWLERRCTALDGLRIPLLEQACAVHIGSVGGIGAIVSGIAVATAAAVLVYVVVPTNGASLRQASLPGLTAGIAIGLLTSLFGLVAPYLVRQWLTLGILGGVFIALLWFRLVFLVLLYGAAWARLRRDRDRREGAPPSL